MPTKARPSGRLSPRTAAGSRLSMIAGVKRARTEAPRARTIFLRWIHLIRRRGLRIWGRRILASRRAVGVFNRRAANDGWSDPRTVAYIESRSYPGDGAWPGWDRLDEPPGNPGVWDDPEV